MLDEGELARLLDAVGRGDQEAVSILYRRVGSLIYGIAHRILRDPGLAETVPEAPTGIVPWLEFPEMEQNR